MTATEIRNLIINYLGSASSITAAEHKSIENALIDYAEATQTQADNLANSILSLIPKKLTIDSFDVNKNYTVATGLDSSKTIMGVIVMLECKTANNGFVVGDIVTAPSPYPVDTSRTSSQGIGVQFINGENIRVVVNDAVTIMSAYVNGATSTGDLTVTPSQWKINLYFNCI